MQQTPRCVAHGRMSKYEWITTLCMSNNRFYNFSAKRLLFCCSFQSETHHPPARPPACLLHPFFQRPAVARHSPPPRPAWCAE